MHQVVVPTTTWAPVARVSAAHPGNVARPVFCGIGSSTAVPTRPVFNGIGSSIAVPTPGAGFALTRATTWAPVARVSAAHPGDVAPPVFCGTGSSTAVPTRPFFNGRRRSTAVPTPGAGFALTRATTWAPVTRVSAAHPGDVAPPVFCGIGSSTAVPTPARFQWPSSFNRRANPGCGRCPYPGYQLNLMVSDSLGSNSFCTMPSSGGGVGAGATGTWAFACAVARARDQSASKVMFCTAYNWP